MTARLQSFASSQQQILPLAESSGHPPVRLELFGKGHPGRDALETEIRGCYAHHFGARVEGFMPYLVRVTLERDATRGVIGLRPAAREGLYLEDYLDVPIEQAVAGVFGRPVARTAVAEIGQLAVEHRRVIVPLFRQLVPFLLQQGFEWVCFTATGPVRSLLARAGLGGCEISAASADRVAGRDDSWGSYYRHDPRVIVGDLRRPAGLTPPRAVAGAPRTGAGS
jgi:hypothetical protein